MRPLDMLYMESGVRYRESKPVAGAYSGKDFNPVNGRPLSPDRVEVAKPVKEGN